MQSYRANKALAASDLKVLDQKTPFHFQQRHLSSRESDSLSFGTLVHTALLEPDIFSAIARIQPSLDKRTKAYKEWLTEQPEDALIITQDDLNIVMTMKQRIVDCGLWPLLQRGDSEASVYNDYQGIELKARPDKLDVDNRMIVDLKTTRDLKWFAKDAIKYGYDFSVAHYKTVMELQSGMIGKWQYVFVAIESEAPYDCDWFVLSQEKEELAYAKWQRAIEVYQGIGDNPKGYCNETPKEI